VTDATNLLQGCLRLPGARQQQRHRRLLPASDNTRHRTGKRRPHRRGVQPVPALRRPSPAKGGSWPSPPGAPTTPPAAAPAEDVFGRDRSVAPAGDHPAQRPRQRHRPRPGGDRIPRPSRATATLWRTSPPAPDLVTDDSNGLTDVFAYDRAKSQTARVSLGLSGAQPDGPSGTDSPPRPVGRRPVRGLRLPGHEPGGR